ncbi:MAG: hypothetical protein HOK92_04145 [Flavobacteriales bacterium]|nr:hypothetical protein [Flavobacteriales bacterium]
MNSSKKFLIIMLALVVTGFFSSCREKADTIANIYVRDESNAIVEDAMVVLYGTNTQGTPQVVAVFDTAYTNAAGLASFNYNDIYQLGQAGVAVLDIKAQKLNKIGQGIIKIEPELVNEETVFIQP